MSTLPPQEIGLYNKLLGDSALAALVGTKIYNSQAPDGTAYPYVIFYIADEGIPNDTPGMRTDTIFRVEALGATRASAKGAFDAAFTALHLQTLTVTGWDNYFTAVYNTRRLIETIAGNQVWRYIMDVNVRLATPVIDQTPAPSESYSEMILSVIPGIYALYPLNETTGLTAEEIVNNYDGTYSGPTLNSIAGPGASMGNAALYDGINDLCALPAASLDGPFDPNLGTILIWMKVAAAGNWTDGLTKVCVVVGVSTTNQVAIFKQGNNTLNYRIIAGGVDNTRTASCSLTSWLCLGMTWNKAQNRIRAYLNGVQQGADLAYGGTFSGTLTNSYCQVCSYNTGVYWHGYPSFAVFSNQEATAAQMAQAAIAA